MLLQICFTILLLRTAASEKILVIFLPHLPLSPAAAAASLNSETQSAWGWLFSLLRQPASFSLQNFSPVLPFHFRIPRR